ncbi:MAG: DUF2634 domain-containing protein [Oscillospiraceae bacterium]|nr:DUF2634 domain-containing protein [Oscillospiraceae bacterium]
MIPVVNEYAASFALREMPSKTHRFDLSARHVRGETDRLEAMRQAVYLIVYTERYRYPIYSRNYGAELEELIGKPIPYVLPEIKRRVTEALTQDTRITGVDGWSFDVQRGKVTATYTVHTIYGELDEQLTVNS